MLNFNLISLGCPKNTADSEKIVNQLQRHGFRLVAATQTAPVMLLNTCAFIKSAVEETEQEILRLIELKKQGEIQYLIVLGCFPSRFDLKELAEKYALVDRWFPIKDAHLISLELIKLTQRHQKHVLSTYIKITPSHYAYLKIAEGCNNLCTYCLIPKIRGKLKSTSLDQLLTEARRYAQMGTKELILVAEDTTIWGNDIYGQPSLDLLVTKLSEIQGIEWIRIMYAYPAHFTSQLISVMKNNPKVCAYLDMPIQHVNSQILKLMNRKYDKNCLVKLLRNLRSKMPNLAIRTTFILGFPYETAEMVDELQAFIQEFSFDHVGCFAYSNEIDASASKLMYQVEEDIKQQRVGQIMQAQYDILQQYNLKFIGQVFTVLYEGNGVARSFRQAPDIDSCILIENVESTGFVVGEFYQVEIVALDGYDLIGRNAINRVST
jgi:ribosomal protein S12 methylthiotransferase